MPAGSWRDAGGAVRDFGFSDPDSRFTNPADAPLVQIPGAGTIWKITRDD